IFADGQNNLFRPLETTIEGGPDWIRSERWDVDATAEGTPGSAMMQGPMLQTLLEERFKVKLHRETREVPVYIVTVAKGGPKLTPFKEGSCVSIVPPPGPQTTLAPGQHRCASFGGRKGPNMIIDVEGRTVEEFAKIFLRGS